MDATVLWNLVLTVLLGAVAFFMSAKFKELDRLSILLNRTREEIARDHILLKNGSERQDHILLFRSIHRTMKDVILVPVVLLRLGLSFLLKIKATNSNGR